MIRWCLLFVTFCLLLGACTPKEPQAEEPALLISGSINRPVKPDLSLPPLAYRPDLEGLRNRGDTSTIQLVAHGGSLLAGYRDGGLFREGQLTAIPVLLAHQMGLTSFVSPLFDPSVGNGTGYLVVDDTDSLPSWKRVNNQLGVLSEKPYKLAKHTGSVPDNLALPHGVLYGAADSSIFRYYYPDQINYYAFLNRLVPAEQEGKRRIDYFLQNRPIHLLLYERDLDLWMGIARFPQQVVEQATSAFGGGTIYYVHRAFISTNLALGRKLVLFTQPDYLDFPFFHLYAAPALRVQGSTTGLALEDSALLIPTDKIKRAFTTRIKGSIVLEDKDVLSKPEINLLKGINRVNNTEAMRQMARDYKLPLVDLYALYKRVLNRQYTTEDGLFIDPSFPSGNFFSQDGIYPSAIGNAVITNEIIKEINNTYHTAIPLINVTEYASRL